MILFFDVETTGLPDRRLPPDHREQPHIVQLACLLTEDDGAERASISVVVNPGVPIPERASAVRGITDETAERCGIPQRAAVALWSQLAGRADTIVAHNINFDLDVMHTAWLRSLVGDFVQQHGHRRQSCTMRAATPVLALPPTDRMRAVGFTNHKAPKLAECVRHFWNEDLDGAHDALVDVRACARLFFHLRTLGAAP